MKRLFIILLPLILSSCVYENDDLTWYEIPQPEDYVTTVQITDAKSSVHDSIVVPMINLLTYHIKNEGLRVCSVKMLYLDNIRNFNTPEEQFSVSVSQRQSGKWFDLRIEYSLFTKTLAGEMSQEVIKGSKTFKVFVIRSNTY